MGSPGTLKGVRRVDIQGFPSFTCYFHMEQGQGNSTQIRKPVHMQAERPLSRMLRIHTTYYIHIIKHSGNSRENTKFIYMSYTSVTQT